MRALAGPFVQVGDVTMQPSLKQFGRAGMAWLTALSVTLGALAPLAPVASLAAVAEARPLAVPVAGVSLDLPAEGFIGEDIAFTVTFDNASPVNVGYGPYIDLFMPLSGVDGTGSGGLNDGLSLLTATYLGSPVALTTLDYPAGSNVTHPLTGLSVACPAAMPGYTGPSPFHWQLQRHYPAV
ncbi:MAG: hypothetical protein V9F04_16935 [Dermatophilaceae bacterium]